MENDTDSSDSNANKNKTPPKVTCKKTKYMQKYNAIWEHEKDFEGWLSMSKKGKHLAYCNACDTDLLIGARGKKDLERHRDSAKHIRNVKGMAKQRTLLSMPHVSGFSTLEKQAKEGEIRLAAFVAEHNLPFKVMEHLPKLMQSVCKDSTIAKTIACSRTKTTAIVKKHTLESRLFESVSCDVADKIDQMMGCRLSRMPLQYIIGNWDFHSITLQVRPPVFIPRPETEELVNISLKYLDGIDNPLVADLCCGSGAISLALLHNNMQLKCVAVDQSKYAVQLAIDNAKNLELSDRITVMRGKITDLEIPILPYEKFDLIVSNPPYVLKKDLMLVQPEIFLYEDLRALDGGIDGLDIIRNIINHGQHILKKDGVMLLEIDPCHKYLLPTWLDENNTSLKITNFHDDFNGMCRFVELRLKSITS